MVTRISELTLRLQSKIRMLMDSYTFQNTVGNKEVKAAQLDEADPVWVSIRHLHMKDAIDTIMTDFSKFAQEHAGFSASVVMFTHVRCISWLKLLSVPTST